MRRTEIKHCSGSSWLLCWFLFGMVDEWIGFHCLRGDGAVTRAFSQLNGHREHDFTSRSEVSHSVMSRL